MKEVELYPRGYMLRVTTWENDADNYQTEELSGLNEEEVNFIIKFTDLFRTSGWQGGLGNLGNLCWGEEETLKSGIDAFIEENGWSCSKDYDGVLSDLGIAGYEHFISRVVESVKVYYIPERVRAFEVVS